MKKIILFILTIVTINVNAQELNGFMGIPFGSAKEEVKKTFMSKNPNSKIYTDKPGTLTMTDFTFGGRTAVAVVFGFGESDKMHTAVVLLENSNGDDYVFELYENVVKDINNKYHYHDINNEMWKYPYDKSDKFNHGATAIKLGKCELQSMWYFDVNDPTTHDDDNIIAVENTQSCTVKISYQNGLLINEVVSKNNEKNSQDY